MTDRKQKKLKKLVVCLSFILVTLVVIVVMRVNDPQNGQIVSLLTMDSNKNFSPVVPGYEIKFPKDYGVHPGFRHEWWYVTANVRDQEGNEYGIQWTVFRFATEPQQKSGWFSNQIFMAHTVVTTDSNTYAFERFGRGGIGQAGVSRSPYSVWLDNWQWQAESEEPFPAILSAEENQTGFELALRQTMEPVMQGKQGFSRKHPKENLASYYFSVPQISIEGKLKIDGVVRDVSGKGWLDREWGSSTLSAEQSGWDWFSVHLDDGSSLMVYQLRGEQSDFRFASLTDKLGVTTLIDNDAISIEPTEKFQVKNDKQLPLIWTINLKEQNQTYIVQPLNKNNWLDFALPYWEGPISVSGSQKGKGFMELTGY
ncbi:lipocalin-like domain-containing protein [Veronia pacifica]|uniref:ABC transporter n=1 Tax=Veronia pacifica TaxID=1080227 RepID=A0A1C3ED90_9GAMM|nr:lipocalin-like domain-containing protein [Veronia pacifica]ODA31211.1 ABC transporter [Veronia pacifica]